MGAKVGILFLLFVGISLFNNVDARKLATANVFGIALYAGKLNQLYPTSAKQVNYNGSRNRTNAYEVDAKNEKVCTLCEQYASLAIDYLGANNTQIEIIDILHLACSQTHSLKQECTSMVDYYASLFFSEIAKVDPGELCSKMNLCDSVAFVSQDNCALCHEAVAEALAKLEDPDTQLQIIQILLKECDKTKEYAKRCKRLVFEYGPLIMANAQNYFVKNDLCFAIHACKTSSDGSEVGTPSVEAALIAAS